MSPSVPPLAGHGGLAAAPSAHSQPDNNFPYITQGLTFRLPAAAEFPTQHGRRRGVSAPVSFPEERRYPKSPRGSLCPSPSSPSSHPSPKSCQHLPPWRAGLRCPRASCRVPAVSPGLAALPGQCRLPWQDSRLGKAAAGGSEVLGEQQGGRRRRSLLQTPSGLASRSRRVPGALPERSRRVPGSFPERRDGGAGSGGIADSGNLPELFTAPSERSFQGCNAKPPSSPCRDIHTPPAPYAACALTQEVGTGWCHLL